MSKIAFIGLGNMGLPMAKNLVAAGHDVTGFDLSAEAKSALKEAGGAAADTIAAAVSAAEVIVSMLPAGKHVSAVYTEAEGVLAHAKAGALLIDSSTIDVDTARAVSAQAEVAGFAMVDAPVSGGKVGAEAGTLTVMASGPDEAFEKARPVLDAIAGEVRELGSEAGLGATYKVVHQLAAGVHLAVAAEVMALGANMGCDPDVLFDIVSKSAGRSWMFTDRVPHMLDDDFTPRSMVDIFVKDLGLVVGAGYDSKTPLPLASAALQLFLAASSMGHGKIDDAAVVKVYESATGAAVKRGG